MESGLKKAPNFDCSCSQKFHFFGLKFQKNIRPKSVNCFKNFDWLTVITRAYNQCKTKKLQFMTKYSFIPTINHKITIKIIFLIHFLRFYACVIFFLWSLETVCSKVCSPAQGVTLCITISISFVTNFYSSRVWFKADLYVNMNISTREEVVSTIRCRLKHPLEQSFWFTHFKPHDHIPKRV